ncbi:hypothetical protein, partial [Glaciecola punicea]|uniref:hypothetical protein n=1 Tax=Glaciecola punicea TaxID=56804 RepID=UPI001EE64717
TTGSCVVSVSLSPPPQALSDRIARQTKKSLKDFEALSMLERVVKLAQVLLIRVFVKIKYPCIFFIMMCSQGVQREIVICI